MVIKNQPARSSRVVARCCEEGEERAFLRRGDTCCLYLAAKQRKWGGHAVLCGNV